jgi:hypothetical protein
MNIASNTLLVLNSNSKRYDNLLTIDIKTVKDNEVKMHGKKPHPGD